MFSFVFRREGVPHFSLIFSFLAPIAGEIQFELLIPPLFKDVKGDTTCVTPARAAGALICSDLL
jgi:hypothetical protein